MAKFDWFPYLQGKYLNYYQWFSLIATTVLLAISLISIFLYLVLCKLSSHPQLNPTKKKLITKLKNITFNGTFVSLTFIPLICTAFDVLYMVEGMLGMMAISTIQIFLDNGRQLWKEDAIPVSSRPVGTRASTVQRYLRLCLQLTPKSKKLLKIAGICAVVGPLLMYKTCLCFFNS